MQGAFQGKWFKNDNNSYYTYDENTVFKRKKLSSPSHL